MIQEKVVLFVMLDDDKMTYIKRRLQKWYECRCQRTWFRSLRPSTGMPSRNTV